MLRKNDRRYLGRAAIRLWLVASVCLTLTETAAVAQAERGPIEIRDLRELEHAFIELSDRVRPSTVALRTYTRARYQSGRRGGDEADWARIPYSHGSGAIIHRDGHILTNTHVIEGADVIAVVLHNGRRYDAQLIQADNRSDLAVLKIDANNLTPVRFGDLSRVRQGQWCFAVGNPFGLANDDGRTGITYGIVSALGKDLNAELNAEADTAAEVRYYGHLIQTSAAINPGNSGGPLFNLGGEMIGVVTAIASRSGVTEGVGFAVPIERRTRSIVDRLGRGEPVVYGYLGVTVGELTRAARQAAGLHGRRGALVRDLDPRDGPAAQAGLRPGDVIVEFGEVTIDDFDHLVRVVGAAPAGERTDVVYFRDGQRRSAAVTLAARDVTTVSVEAGPDESDPRTLYWRGALLAEATDALLQERGLRREQFGLAVVEVVPGSDADRAGLGSDQVVLEFDEQRVHTVEEFVAADQQASARVRLRVRAAGGRTKTVRMPQHTPSE